MSAGFFQYRIGTRQTLDKGYRMSEVEQHCTENSCWIVVDGKVYDMTGFLGDHPGGRRALLRWAGKDATEVIRIQPAHNLSRNTIADKLAEAFLGVLLD